MNKQSGPDPGKILPPEDPAIVAAVREKNERIQKELMSDLFVRIDRDRDLGTNRQR